MEQANTVINNYHEGFEIRGALPEMLASRLDILDTVLDNAEKHIIKTTGNGVSFHLHLDSSEGEAKLTVLTAGLDPDYVIQAIDWEWNNTIDPEWGWK